MTDDLNDRLARIDDAEQAALTGMGIITGPTPAQIERDSCRLVEVDGQMVRVRGDRDMDDIDRAMLAKVIDAAKRKFEADTANSAKSTT